LDPVTLAVLGGSSLVSGLMGSSASRRAAETQARAAREAAQLQLQAAREGMQLQRDLFGQALQVQAPYLRSSQAATAALMGGLGLGDMYQAPEQEIIGAPAGERVTYGATPQEMAAAASGPFAGRFQERFRPSDITLDPSYQFRVQQGLRALQASRAATGMLQTGQGLKDITDYGQQAASQEYQAAFNRFQTEQQRDYERLAALAGIGPQVAGTTAGGLQQLGTGLSGTLTGGQTAAGQLTTSGAAAQAAGEIGQANAVAQALGGGIQNWMTLQALARPQFGYYTGGQFVGPPNLYSPTMLYQG
jgi:hypothetical protein